MTYQCMSRFCIIYPTLKIFSSYKMRKSAGENPLYPLEVGQYWIILVGLISAKYFNVCSLQPMEVLASVIQPL